ncbi:hypothetical protein DSECCO2_493440 [anaerobic digester metagenome]
MRQITPHDEFREGEETQDGAFFHIPLLFSHDGTSDFAEDLQNINGIALHGQGIQSLKQNAEVIFEHFSQCDIEVPFFFPWSQKESG